MRDATFLMLALVLAAGVAQGQATDLHSLLCNPEGWEHNPQYVSISRQAEHVKGNGPGLLFEYTRDSKDLFDKDRNFNNQAYRPSATKTLPNLDLSGWDVLSFWIYVEGNAEEAFQWGLGSARPFRLSCRAGEWFEARWFLSEAPCDLKKVERICFAGVNQGSPPGDPKRAKIYLSDFKLEKSGRHIHVGWDPDPNEIVLPYTGVYPGEAVVAVVAARHAGKAYALSGDGTKQTGRASDAKRSRRAEYAEVHITAPEKPGDYMLKIEGGPSARVRVREHPYDEAVGKALRTIRAQRCGCASELHGPCHLDDAVREDTGKAVDIAGGWHDEGVSQFPHLTARTEANLARFRRSHNRKLGLGLNEGCDDDLLAEVEWGARSILKYELEPGVCYHSLVAPFWFYTDNQPGTGDERKITVYRQHQLETWWRTEALAIASGLCSEPMKSQCRAAAERWWAHHQTMDERLTKPEREKWEMDEKNLRATAVGIGASIELFRLTGDRKHADDAAQTADYLLTFQERTPAGEGGFVGYFYKNLGHPEPYVGVNGKSLDIPGRPMAELLMALPDHPHAPAWREAMKLYADGTLKPLARWNAPYGCVAAGPFHKPVTDLFEAEKHGDLLVYPFPIFCSARGKQVTLRHGVTQFHLTMAAQMAALGEALGDEELTRMAHGVVRYVLGANPFHVSLMRNLGERWPVNAQLPNVPGSIVGWLGVTSQGLPFFDPYGAGRLDGPDRFMVKEGNTAMCSYLLDVCSYLENRR